MGTRSRCALAILVAALGSALSTPASAVTAVGSEFLVNSYTEDVQTSAAVAVDAAGNFVVAWQSSYPDGDNFGIFGQRFSSDGTRRGEEFQINSYTQEAQVRPAAASDAAGNFVVAWASRYQDGSLYGVFGQRFASSGAPLGTEFQIPTYTLDHQDHPAISSEGAGNFVVVWDSNRQDGDSRGIFAQLFDSGGSPVGSEFQINTVTAGNQGYPALATDMMGDFVVVWQSFSQDGQSYGIFGQRFASAGAPLGTEFQINTYFTGTQVGAAVASDGAGDFVVAWQSAAQDGGASGIFAQRFAADGSAVGGEFQVNTYTPDSQTGAAIFSDKNGNFVVAWTSNNQDGSGSAVIAQRFAPSGERVGGELQVNTYTPGFQFASAIGGAPSGRFVIAWSSRDQDGSEDGIFAERFAPGDTGAAPLLSHGLLMVLGGALAALGARRLGRRRPAARGCRRA